MSRENYFIEKEKSSGMIKYFEYNLKDGYKITPKVKKDDAISVSKVVFASPSLSEKIIKKKLNNIISKLLEFIKETEEGGNDTSSIRKSLMQAEKIRINIITKYVKYLGNNYCSLTLKKMELIINKLENELYVSEIKDKYKEYYLYENYKEEENKKGRGR